MEIVADVVASICTTSSNGTKKFGVIDAGDGKGYLSTRLSIEHDIKVLGIDFNPTNTVGALVRSDKLGRFWDGVKTNTRKKRRHQSPSSQHSDNVQRANEQNAAILLKNNYRNATHFITPQLNFAELFMDNFDLAANERPDLCLSGLHTCGDLAPTCLKVFAENDRISAVCNIGCCYHKLTEQFNRYNQHEYNPFQRVKKLMSGSPPKVAECHEPSTTGFGFPMSRYLIECDTAIGRTARMLACNSIHRLVDKKEPPNRHLFYRALLEILIQRKCPEYLDRTEVGRLKQCHSFAEYVRGTNKRNPWLGFDVEHITDDELLQLHNEFRRHEALLDVYHLMRVSLATVTETILMLDRLLYLKENELNEQVPTGSASYLVRFFDPVISPRCFGLVAMKPVAN